MSQKPFQTLRSLVGMTMGARKRAARRWLWPDDNRRDALRMFRDMAAEWTTNGEKYEYGHGFRRCAGEHVAQEMVRLVLRRFQVQLLPDESDLRPVGLITQRLAKVVGVMTRNDGGM